MNVPFPTFAHISPFSSQSLNARVIVLKFKSRKSANSRCGGNLSPGFKFPLLISSSNNIAKVLYIGGFRLSNFGFHVIG